MLIVPSDLHMPVCLEDLLLLIPKLKLAHNFLIIRVPQKHSKIF